MKISFDLPMRAAQHWDEWIGGAHLGDLAEAVESGGLHGVGFADHPIPADSWLEVGGHQAFDPFVALAVAGARTDRIRLMTNLAIAGHRPGLVTAKAAASLDALLGGRVTLGMGAGYLQEEFAALGVDYRSRGAGFDAVIGDIRQAWSGESFVPHAVAASGGVATSRALPTPVQRGGPPIWIGGNSRRARRRVAELGDGWLPFVQGEEQAGITRTDSLRSLDVLAGQIEQIRSARRDLGRDDAFDVCLMPGRFGRPEALIEFLEEFGRDCEEMGVTWLTWQSSARAVGQCMDDIAAVGAYVSERWGVTAP